VWLSVDRYGQVWTGEDSCRRLWTGMDSYGQVWTVLDRCRQLLTGMDSCGKVWTAVDRYGQHSCNSENNQWLRALMKTLMNLQFS